MKSTNFKYNSISVATKMFWESIDNGLPKEDTLCFEYYDHLEQHEEFYEECLAFDDWISHSLQNIPNQIDITTDSNQQFPGRWVIIPTEKSFPKIHKYFEDNADIYSRPVIQKLDPKGKVHVHNHGIGIVSAYTYNMSLNYPKEVRFGFYPQGEIPYKAGDIYKLYVENDHSVLNKSTSVRYHIVFHPSSAVVVSKGFPANAEKIGLYETLLNRS